MCAGTGGNVVTTKNDKPTVNVCVYWYTQTRVGLPHPGYTQRVIRARFDSVYLELTGQRQRKREREREREIYTLPPGV